jgi:uncharacterized membrane protein
MERLTVDRLNDVHDDIDQQSRAIDWSDGTSGIEVLPMIGGHPRALTLVAAVGTGLAAGVFFAFSTFVMTGLRNLPSIQGLTAMQAINKAAPTPLFLLVLLGSAVICVILGIWALSHLGQPSSVYLLVGSLLYLAGIALTIGYHIPHNNALALVNPMSANAAEAWRHYASSWTAWNHVRALTSIGATVTFGLALRLG